MLGTSKVANLYDVIVTKEVGGFDITVTDGVSVQVPEPGFIFGRLARDTHFDNVTRRHRYSWRTSGLCEWQREEVVSFFHRFVLEEKGPFEGMRAPSQKGKRHLFLKNKPIKNDTTSSRLAKSARSP